MGSRRNDRKIRISDEQSIGAAKREVKTLKYSELLEALGRPSLIANQDESRVNLIGYGKTIEQVKRQIAKNENFIVSGPKGVGKTSVIRHLVGNRKLFYIDARWLTNKHFAFNCAPETQLVALVKEAIVEAPSAIFLDNIEYVAPMKRNQSDLKERIFNELCNQLEEVQSITDDDNAHLRLLVIAATDQPEQLDLRITELFPEEIKFPVPSLEDRLEKLKHVFPEFSNKQRESIADATHCYLFKDLDRLRFKSLDENLELNYESVEKALTTFKPKRIKDYTTPYQPIRWSDIGGCERVKRELEETVIKPLKDRGRYMEFCPTRSKGVILYGPAGCSKTMLAQALATESGHNFISIKGPELFTKYVGDTEAAIRKLFRNAREIAPCIIFFDEIDGFASERTHDHSSSVNEKVVTTLLTEFNGPPDDVFVIAATNRPERIDSALMRPGRLSTAIYIPLPSTSDRVGIFKVHMRSYPRVKPDMIDAFAQELAPITQGYSGADIMEICRVAGLCALREETTEAIELRHFYEAIHNVHPSVTSVKSYEDFSQRGIKHKSSNLRTLFGRLRVGGKSQPNKRVAH